MDEKGRHREDTEIPAAAVNEGPDDGTIVVHRSEPEDGTVVVDRSAPEDGTVVVDRSAPDDGTIVVDRSQPDDGTVVVDRSGPRTPAVDDDEGTVVVDRSAPTDDGEDDGTVVVNRATTDDGTVVVERPSTPVAPTKRGPVMRTLPRRGAKRDITLAPGGANRTATLAAGAGAVAEYTARDIPAPPVAAPVIELGPEASRAPAPAMPSVARHSRRQGTITILVFAGAIVVSIVGLVLVIAALIGG